MFDVIKYLESEDIDYHVAGEKNVTKGNIGITCPMPDCDDKSWHCNIHLEDQFFKCWNCNGGGQLNYLVACLQDCSWAQANTIISRFQTEFPERPIGSHPSRENIQPDPQSDPLRGIKGEVSFPRMHLDYLRGRNFDPDLLIPEYGLKAISNVGPYRFRILVPIVQNGEMVSFTTRDVTGRSTPYLHCPDGRSITPIKDCLYNLDSVGDKVIIVEGVTDVWRLGKGTVATFGTNFTKRQVELLHDRGIERAFVLFDPEEQAQRKARELTGLLALFVRWVERLELASGDPADMSPERVLELKKNLNFS